MQLDLLVGGMPRGGTTLAAKLMSLHQDVFCYAGETHLIPMMLSMFGSLPCRSDRIGPVADYLRRQLFIEMVERPRLSVNQGAHPKNLIFDGKDVRAMVQAITECLERGIFGSELYLCSLAVLRDSLEKVDQRPVLGEKTPNNIFAIAESQRSSSTRNLIVMREPFGVLRSMRARVEGGDAYSGVFEGNLESGIGMYLEYGEAALRSIRGPGSNSLVRYEEMASSPASVVTRLYSEFGLVPEERVLRFVEGSADKELADRAPVNYRRLRISGGFGRLCPSDAWKVLNMTRAVREPFGYTDEVLASYGYHVGAAMPEEDVATRIVPMYGFHLEEAMPWMRRKGRLIVYVAECRSHTVLLRFASIFPEQVPGSVELRLQLEGRSRATARVGSGYQAFTLELKLDIEDFKPMGPKGGYATLDLESSMAFVPIAHMAESGDAREVSFQLVKTQISRDRI